MEVVCGSFAQEGWCAKDDDPGEAGYVGLHWLYRTNVHPFGNFHLLADFL